MGLFKLFIMKKTIILLFFLVCSNIIAQVRITYTVKINYDENDNISTYEKSAIDNAKHLLFELIIDGDKANFFIVNTLTNDADIKGADFARALTYKAREGYYIDFKKKKYYYNIGRSPMQELNNFLIVGDMNKSWELTNESKLINNYKVIKAKGKTSEKKSDVANIEAPPKAFEIPIEAWYCPEINLPFGPIGMGDLPGLILELNYGKIKYTFHKIDFNYKMKKGIKVLNKGEEIDYNSYITIFTQKTLERIKELGINLNKN